MLGLAVGVYALARVWRLTTYSLRPDEIFSLQAARHDWSGLLAVAARDAVHPPLFYSLLKIWTTIGGESELWLRLLPVLVSLAALLPFVLLGRELELRAAELNLVLILMAVNGYLVYYAQELRMYSLLLGLTLCSLWLFARFVNRPDDTGTAWVLLAVTVLLVYTQYYGWLVVAAELVFLLIWNRTRLPVFAGIVAGAALAFSPWLYLVVRRVIGRGLEPNIGSFAVPTWRDVAGLYAALVGSLGGGWMMLPGAVLFVGPVALWAARLLWSRRPADPRPAATFRWLVLSAALPVVVAYAVSHALPHSVWGTRFLIVVAPACMMLIGLAVFRLRQRSIRLAAVLLMVAWAALAGIREVNSSGKNAWQPLVHRMMHAEPSRVGGIMVYTIESSDETIAFYLHEAHDERFKTKRVQGTSDMTGDHFWVALRSRVPALQRELTARGYHVGEGFRDGFGGVLFPAWRS